MGIELRSNGLKVRDHIDEQDKMQGLKYLYERGKRLMIIKLRKYNGVGELLIGLIPIGLWDIYAIGTGPGGYL